MWDPREPVSTPSMVLFLSLCSVCIIQEVWQVFKEGSLLPSGTGDLDFGLVSIPCLCWKLPCGHWNSGTGEGGRCFV